MEITRPCWLPRSGTLTAQGLLQLGIYDPAAADAEKNRSQVRTGAAILQLVSVCQKPVPV